MDNLLSDLRFTLRSFSRRPGLFAVAVLTLTLGIGSSTAMFSVIDSVLLDPLEYPEPEEIHAVYPAWPDLVGHPTLGDLALRGERGVLRVTPDDMLRLRWNPFYPWLERRVLEFVGLADSPRRR